MNKFYVTYSLAFDFAQTNLNSVCSSLSIMEVWSEEAPSRGQSNGVLDVLKELFCNKSKYPSIIQCFQTAKMVPI